jgi:GNAT superfamily N-acetyltransferase
VGQVAYNEASDQTGAYAAMNDLPTNKRAAREYLARASGALRRLLARQSVQNEGPEGAEWSARFVSRKGREVRARHLRAEDAGLLVDLFDQLSPRTRYLRFFAPLTNISREEVAAAAAHFASVDHSREDALIGLIDTPEGERAVGVARFAQRPGEPSVAEAAIVVRDDYQGEGVGRQLFMLLIERARARGIRTIAAATIAENRVVLEGLRRSGFPHRSETHRGETTIELYI